MDTHYLLLNYRNEVTAIKDNLLSRIGNHVILDQIESWPHEIYQIIFKNEGIIRAYLQLEDEIDKQAEEDVLLRVNRPQNQYKTEWLSINNQLEDELKSGRFVGFHCTKLTDSEIYNVSTCGLKPLSREMLDYRIDQLMSNKIAEQLKNNNLSSESNRKGKIFFFHCLKTLKEESGLYRLFRSWGGEALYANHERNKEAINELLSIGKPCIVLGSLGYNEINPYPSLGSKFISVFLNKNNPKRNYYDFDNWVQNSVAVLSAITVEDELFEKLTGFSTWKLDR